MLCELKKIKVKRSVPSTAGMGFTLIELILAVAILGIMAGIVIPRMGWATMGKVQAKTAARQFASYLKLTRSLAITNATTNSFGFYIQLSPPGGSSYTSYEIIDFQAMETVKGPIEIPTGVICTGQRYITFTYLGQSTSAQTETVQFSKAGDTTVVSVTPLGRITVQ